MLEKEKKRRNSKIKGKKGKERKRGGKSRTVWEREAKRG